LRGESVASLFDVVKNKNNQYFCPSPLGAFFFGYASKKAPRGKDAVTNVVKLDN
jgi:hypothetical protein